MNALETLPVYLTPCPDEKGPGLGIDFESYKRLAKTSLAIIRDDRLTMGLYRLQGGCALDIFGETNCLSILIDVSENEVSLFVCPMDAPFGSAVCLLSADNSDDKSWRKLLRLAKSKSKA
jgi:hypothetical protein